MPVFLDLSIAFERIDHSISIRKPLRYKVSSYIVNILSSIFMRVKSVYILTARFPIVDKLNRVSGKKEFYLLTFLRTILVIFYKAFLVRI